MIQPMLSPFVDADYHSDRDIQKHYRDQMITYAQKRFGVSEEEAKQIVEKHFRANNGTYEDRKIKILEKNKYGDRELKVVTASEFFENVQENNYHLSPSLVAYKNSEEEQSVNSIGTERFLSLRKLYKGKRQEAKGSGDKWAEKTYDVIQNALKIFNNAQSGAMSSNGTPLVNKSGHTSLTSTCRGLTSTANICNEKFLAGNRLYNTFENTLQNIIATVQYTDLKRMQEVMDKHGMQHATVEQVMNMIRHSTERYWRNAERMKTIEGMIKVFKPVELTAVLCILDLEGLRVTNRKVLYELLDDFSKVPEVPVDAKAEDYPKPDTGDRYVLCVSKIVGKPSQLQINHLNAWHLECEQKWADFIEVFLKQSIPPSGVYNIKDMIREVVLTSDTDSSIYTVDTVVDEYTKDRATSLRTNGVLTYFIRMISVHQHAQFSENMNVAKRFRYRLNMKNEYLFGAYVTTTMSKHYFATQLMVEGVMNKEVEMEIKGVHLRSAKIAANIKSFAHALMREVLDAIHDHRQLDAADVLFRAAELEREIINDIEAGNWKWLTKGTIKDGAIYSKPESSVFQYHVLWERIFSRKYGHAPELPYTAIKVNAKTLNRAAIAEWIETLDPAIQEDAKIYMDGKTKLTTIYVPEECLGEEGIPKEVIAAADIRSIIKQNLKCVYAVLESLGLFIVNSKITRIISDEH